MVHAIINRGGKETSPPFKTVCGVHSLNNKGAFCVGAYSLPLQNCVGVHSFSP